jgi:hypothetical protein
MIFALVDVHKSKDMDIGDVIKGKGNGLILLLHGGPGTGKVSSTKIFPRYDPC